MEFTTQERLALIGSHAAGLVRNSMTVGLGTGSTASAMVDALGVLAKGGLKFTGVATSVATEKQAKKLGIPMKDLNDVDRLDLCIDGADEIDPHLNVTKGHGGALLLEKLVAMRADKYVIISADEKLVNNIGDRMSLPVEVVRFGWKHTSAAITELGMTPEIRTDSTDQPFVTDSGNFILDCGWPQACPDLPLFTKNLKGITGVVEHGLFLNMVDVAFTIDGAGQIIEHQR